MTESADPPQGTPSTTVTVYDPRVKSRAYELFLESDYTATEIAVAINVRPEVVRGWINGDKWMLKKQERERELIIQAESKARKFILDRQNAAREQHHRIGQNLELAIEAVLTKVQSAAVDLDMSNAKAVAGYTGNLKRLAESLTHATTVVARAVGMTDEFANNMSAKIADAMRQGGSGARPLAIIGNVTVSENPNQIAEALQASLPQPIEAEVTVVPPSPKPPTGNSLGVSPL